ncbi:MAG: type II toxin-antitoxin system Phd/YefM family antitoxin [Micromonosporaceae bacterium]
MPDAAHWQVQEAKQRFSEVLRAVERDGPQIITRHGEEVAVVISIEEYRGQAEPQQFGDALLGGPYFDDKIVAVLEEVEAERKREFPREIDLGIDT